MAESLRVGVLGAGWAGLAHARGYAAAGGYKIDSVCDLIPARLAAFQKEFPTARIADTPEAMIKDPGIDVLSICLPTDLHAVWAVKALRAGKQTVIETPPALDSKGMRAMLRAAEKACKVLLPAFQRRYGTHEAAARQAVDKGYIGTPYHARASWLRPSGIPQGARTAEAASGWYTDPARSGGGALLDLGLPMLELTWALLGHPKPLSAFAVTHSPLAKLPVDEAGSALIRFEGGKSLELSAAWTMKLTPSQQGLTCRVHGTDGAVDVYTANGATLYRGAGELLKPTLLKGPKVVHHAALMRDLKSLLKTPVPTPASSGSPDPLTPARQSLVLMQIFEALYRSAKTGKGVDIRD